mgnify:CR=1 FL=1
MQNTMSWRKHWIWMVCGLSLLYILPSHTHAQSSRLYFAKAKNLYRTGLRLVQRQKYTEALIEFETAVAAIKNAIRSTSSQSKKNRYHRVYLGVLFTVGRTYQYNRQWKKAYTSYYNCSKLGASANIQRQIQAQMPKVLPHVMSTLQLRTNPSGTTVLLETSTGFKKRQTPFTISVRPGDITFTMTYPGYKRKRIKLYIPPGARLSKFFSLDGTEATTTRQPPSVDRRPTPVAIKRRSLTTRTYKKPPKPTQSTGVQWLPWTLVGVGVAAIAGGATALYLGQSELSKAKDVSNQGNQFRIDYCTKNPTICDQNNGGPTPGSSEHTTFVQYETDFYKLANDGNTKTLVGWIIIGAGAVASVTGIILLAMPPKKPQPTTSLLGISHALPAIGGPPVSR